MYIKSISEFIMDSEQVNTELRDGIVDILQIENQTDNDSEMDSWGASLPVLANILKELPDEIKNNCEICLEACFQSDERADAVIVGKMEGQPVAVIIENKQWSRLNDYSPITDLCLRDPFHENGFVEHPCHQVSHYKYILEHTNAYCQDNHVAVYTAVFIHNATEQERQAHEGPFDNKYAEMLEDNPVFVSNGGTNDSLGLDLKQYLETKFDSGQTGLANDIYSSERRESDAYRRTIANVFGNSNQLLDIFDENQIAIFEEIRQCVISHQDEKRVFIVEGDPGTGKTFVAEALIAYLYGGTDEITAKLVLKNKDPRRALQRSGMPRPAMTYGLKGDQVNYDCIICDESHRMLEQVWAGQDNRDNIEVIINQSRVSVFFYDQRQRVHVNDYVTLDRIRDKAIELGISNECIFKRRLEYQHRLLASDHFMHLVDRILYEPQRGLEGINFFDEDELYQVRLIATPRELFYKIHELNDNRAEGVNGSRVLAGKGRTNGVDWQWMDDNEPLTRRKTLGPFRNDDGNKYVWNLHNYPEPNSFASEDTSINLVGCLDTSQGLDFEYIGLILSPDIEYDISTNMVHINLEGHQQGDPNLNIRNHQNEREVLELIIKNTYRVLASRGAKGCFIYCSDENLQNYLSAIIPVMRVEVPENYHVYPPEEDEPEVAVNNVAMCIGNSFNRSFHNPDCQYAPRNPQKRIEFASRDNAVNAGYQPCRTCNP